MRCRSRLVSLLALLASAGSAHAQEPTRFEPTDEDGEPLRVALPARAAQLQASARSRMSALQLERLDANVARMQRDGGTILPLVDALRDARDTMPATERRDP